MTSLLKHCMRPGRRDGMVMQILRIMFCRWTIATRCAVTGLLLLLRRAQTIQSAVWSSWYHYSNFTWDPEDTTRRRCKFWEFFAGELLQQDVLSLVFFFSDGERKPFPWQGYWNIAWDPENGERLCKFKESFSAGEHMLSPVFFFFSGERKPFESELRRLTEPSLSQW